MKKTDVSCFELTGTTKVWLIYTIFLSLLVKILSYIVTSDT
jgi:hypothetical protein